MCCRHRQPTGRAAHHGHSRSGPKFVAGHACWWGGSQGEECRVAERAAGSARCRRYSSCSAAGQPPVGAPGPHPGAMQVISPMRRPGQCQKKQRECTHSGLQVSGGQSASKIPSWGRRAPVRGSLGSYGWTGASSGNRGNKARTAWPGFHAAPGKIWGLCALWRAPQHLNGDNGQFESETGRWANGRAWATHLAEQKDWPSSCSSRWPAGSSESLWLITASEQGQY